MKADRTNLDIGHVHTWRLLSTTSVFGTVCGLVLRTQFFKLIHSNLEYEADVLIRRVAECVCIQHRAVGAAMKHYMCVQGRLSLTILSQRSQRRVKIEYNTICVFLLQCKEGMESDDLLLWIRCTSSTMNKDVC